MSYVISQANTSLWCSFSHFRTTWAIFVKGFQKNAFFEPIKYLFFKYLQLSHIHTSFKHASLIIHFLLVSENTLSRFMGNLKVRKIVVFSKKTKRKLIKNACLKNEKRAWNCNEVSKQWEIGGVNHKFCDTFCENAHIFAFLMWVLYILRPGWEQTPNHPINICHIHTHTHTHTHTHIHSPIAKEMDYQTLRNSPRSHSNSRHYPSNTQHPKKRLWTFFFKLLWHYPKPK